MQVGCERIARPILLRASPRRRERASWRPSDAPVSDTTRESIALERWFVSNSATCRERGRGWRRDDHANNLARKDTFPH